MHCIDLTVQILHRNRNLKHLHCIRSTCHNIYIHNVHMLIVLHEHYLRTQFEHADQRKTSCMVYMHTPAHRNPISNISRIWQVLCTCQGLTTLPLGLGAVSIWCSSWGFRVKLNTLILFSNTTTILYGVWGAGWGEGGVCVWVYS